MFQLQEHFKATKNVDSFFKNNFKHYDSFVIPAQRENYQTSGRAKGGLSQMTRKSLNIKKERLETKSWRIQAQIVHISSYKFLWINTYLPTDPLTIVFDDRELDIVLMELENLIEKHSNIDWVIGGDLNFEPKRTTGFTSKINYFMEKHDLCSIWDK